jgi:very-short-patch-repair endonuclease/DNA polymerase III delta prime subunit
MGLNIAKILLRMDSKIAKALEVSRQELLDIGLRGNTLLNFNPRAHSLNIVDELSKEIYKILVEKQAPMSFLPLPKDLQKDEVQPSNLFPELFEEKGKPNRHTDNKLQTKLNQDQLDKKLLKINTEAETYYQEQGIDVLYIALGFLSWYDSENSDIERKAPLILIPVNLNRFSAQERFKLKYTEVDLGTNLTLKAKLKTDFTIELPEFDDVINIDDYFKEVNKVIKKQERWKIIENEINLGFFKFGKFQMYQDLDVKGWPEDKQPSDHPIIKSLFGDGFYDFKNENELQILDSDITPLLQSLENFHFIADADSSQTEAILKIKQGKNLVIQGPPGTGKSQTITNIIAELLSENKKILFVSEKMVALEVVKRRLDNCSIGDAVLELHSHKSNKKAVLEELKRTLELGEPKIKNREYQISQYKETQKKLDSYSDAIKEKILNSDLNFVKAVGCLIRYKSSIKDIEKIDLQIHSLENWSKEKYFNSIKLIEELVVYIEEYGVPNKNHFSESTITYFSPVDKSIIEECISLILNDFNETNKSVKKVLELIPLKCEFSILETNRLLTFIKHLKQRPDINEVDYSSDVWLKKGKEIKLLIEEGLELDKIYSEYSSIFIDEAFSFDLIGLRTTFLTKGSKWWNFLSSEYNKAKNTLRGLLNTKPQSNLKSIELIDSILKYQKLKKDIQRKDELGSTIFKGKWNGVDSNWKELQIIFNWLKELYDEIQNNKISYEIPNLLGELKKENVIIFGKEISNYITNLTSNLDLLYEKIEIKRDYKKINFSLLENQISNMQNNTHLLFEIARFNTIREKLINNDLGAIAGLGFSWSNKPLALLKLFQFNYYNSLVNFAYEEKEAIKYFDNISHLKTIKEFKKFDEELSYFAQESLTLRHYNNLPNINAPGEMALIRRETNKKKRHIPIRQLLLKAGNAIQQIKPVFMMSPMSVATFLKQGALEFDLVIFDEASQVKVVDALIPILRGKQIVVVGDSKQMPPTDFFSRTFENEENEDENLTGDIESVLGMFLVQGADESMLKWHYRSRHDSLINVSNQEFYDGRLMIFPSSGTDEKATGLRYNCIPNSIYERGTSRTNPIEAREVAKAVLKHAKYSPELTLGVVAFSTAQRDCIIMELERLRRLDATFEKFFSKTNLEDFFVKNLENVQGDERDIIFISIGYGKTAHRKVTGNFGPVNREGGERRLNVLITRARLGMEVFCNFSADDLETKSTTPFGVKALKSFLKYAETGVLENNKETGKETDSPFEDQVIRAIKQLGYDVEPQVGSAGFFIDIAVIDPVKKGKYILAVECDGASYHSSANARDRDRLRQNVLENMGWKFHRIWSTDWFRTQKKQVVILKEAIEKAILESKNKIESKELVEEGIYEIPRKEVKDIVLKKKKYQLLLQISNIDTSYDILYLSDEIVAKYILEIVSYEGAIHIKDAAKRITDSYYIGRVGNRIFSKITTGAEYGHRNMKFYFSNNIIYKDESKIVEIRDRSEVPNNLKHIEHIPKEEIQSAIIKTIEMAFSITEQEVISEALSMMGFNRATSKSSDIVNKEITNLLKGKSIAIMNEKLFIENEKSNN